MRKKKEKNVIIIFFFIFIFIIINFVDRQATLHIHAYYHYTRTHYIPSSKRNAKLVTFNLIENKVC